MSIIDHFEYGTWEMIENDKGTVTKRTGFRYGHLALLRVDFMCDNCDELHEAWGVANLAACAYMFPGAVFKNVDDGTSYIYAIAPLAKWDTATVEDIAKVASKMLYLCIKNNGLPNTVLGLIEGTDISKGGLVAPGTIAGLNGYTKQ